MKTEAEVCSRCAWGAGGTVHCTVCLDGSAYEEHWLIREGRSKALVDVETLVEGRQAQLQGLCARYPALQGLPEITVSLAEAAMYLDLIRVAMRELAPRQTVSDKAPSTPSDTV